MSIYYTWKDARARSDGTRWTSIISIIIYESHILFSQRFKFLGLSKNKNEEKDEVVFLPLMGIVSPTHHHLQPLHVDASCGCLASQNLGFMCPAETGAFCHCVRPAFQVVTSCQQAIKFCWKDLFHEP